MVGYKALNTRTKYRKTEQLSVFLYFHLSQLHSLKGTKKKEISIGNFLLLFRASCRIRTNDPEITNHVLWPTELKRRVGSYLHRAATTNYLCYVPVLEDSKGAGRARLPMLLTCESKPFKGRKPSVFNAIAEPFLILRVQR